MAPPVPNNQSIEVTLTILIVSVVVISTIIVAVYFKRRQKEKKAAATPRESIAIPLELIAILRGPAVIPRESAAA